jgi:hypothetical protein
VRVKGIQICHFHVVRYWTTPSGRRGSQELQEEDAGILSSRLCALRKSSRGDSIPHTNNREEREFGGTRTAPSGSTRGGQIAGSCGSVSVSSFRGWMRGFLKKVKEVYLGERVCSATALA